MRNNARTTRQRVAGAASAMRRIDLTEDELDRGEAILAGMVTVLHRNGFTLDDADLCADLPLLVAELLALRRRRRGPR